MRKPSTNYRAISDSALIETLASPVRQEIVDTMAALGGEACIADLAIQLGRHADGLYYHLKILCAKGLVVALEDKSRDEQRYCLAGGGTSPLRLAYRPDKPSVRPALRKFAKGLLQVAGQDFETALDQPGVVVEGRRRQLWAARNKAWLSGQELEEVNVLLERLCDLMSKPRTPDRDQLLSFAFVLAPVPGLPKRRSAEGDD